MDSPHKRSVGRCLDVFFPVSLNKLLNKHSSCRWLQTTYCSCDVTAIFLSTIINHRVLTIYFPPFQTCTTPKQTTVNHPSYTDTPSPGPERQQNAYHTTTDSSPNCGYPNLMTSPSAPLQHRWWSYNHNELYNTQLTDEQSFVHSMFTLIYLLFDKYFKYLNFCYTWILTLDKHLIIETNDCC